MKYENSRVSLNWALSEQINVASYEVQRTFSGEYFETVGVVDPDPSQLNYSFEEILYFSENVFYRVKAIDWDGAVNYSEIRSVNAVSNEQISLDIFPDPTSNGQIKVQFNSNRDENKRLYIWNMAGAKVYS